MGCRPWGRKESGTTEWLTLTYLLNWPGTGLCTLTKIQTYCMLCLLRRHKELTWPTELKIKKSYFLNFYPGTPTFNLDIVFVLFCFKSLAELYFSLSKIYIMKTKEVVSREAKNSSLLLMVIFLSLHSTKSQQERLAYWSICLTSCCSLNCPFSIP